MDRRAGWAARGSEPLVGAVGAGAVVALGEAGLSGAGPADADGAAALGAGSEPLVGAVGAGAVVALGEVCLSEVGPADADGAAALGAGSEPPVGAVGVVAVVALGEVCLSEAGLADADGAVALGAGSEPPVGAVEIVLGLLLSVGGATAVTPSPPPPAEPSKSLVQQRPTPSTNVDRVVTVVLHFNVDLQPFHPGLSSQVGFHLPQLALGKL